MLADPQSASAARAQAAAKPAVKAMSDQSTMMADSSSPEVAKVQAQIASTMAAGGAPAARPAPAAKAPVSEQSTMMADASSSEIAKIQAQIAASQKPPPAAPPPAAKPADALMNASTAILDANSPEHAKVQAQIAAAAGRGAPPPAAAPMAGKGAPPVAGRNAPPPAAPPAPGGGTPQRTVMLDTPIPPQVARMQQAPKQRLAPVEVKAPPKQATWHRWVVGPSLMCATAGITWFVAGYALPAKAVKEEKPPPKMRPIGRIQLKTTPPGASVKVDDHVLPHFTPTPVEGFVDDTSHLTITLSGYKPHEEDVIFHKDERPLSIVLDKIDEAPFEVKKRSHAEKPKKEKEEPQGKGSISIFVHPWAIVFVDGTRLRQTPIANFELASGKHEFKLVNEGLSKTETISLTIKPGTNPEIRREWAK
jgi:hypothetical protein